MKISERGIYMFSKAQRKKITNFIQSCTSNRVHELCEDFNSAKRYQDFIKETGNIYAELRKTLSEESLNLVRKYGDLHTFTAVDEYENFYKHGAMDCFELINSLSK